MARQPRPWYRKDRRAWFVTIDGVRSNLGAEKKAALEKFHQMMGEPRKRVAPSGSLVQLIDAFLEWCQQHRAADTYEWYRFRLQRFAETYPDLTVRELRPFHVQRWLDQMNGLASGSKRNYCRAIKRTMNWAQRQGYVDQNPIAFLEQPKAGRRETVLSEGQFEELLGVCPDQNFRDLLVVTWETGCRPQESLRVEARHVDLTNARWVFPQSESKTGIPRVVYLSDRALEITRRLVLAHPEGKLFRNSDGEAWTTDSVNCAFIRLQSRLGRQLMKARGLDVTESQVRELAKRLLQNRVRGAVTRRNPESDLLCEARRRLRNKLACQLGPKYSLYVLRHSWATHALERGVDALTVAVLMGHRDPSTLARVYQHLTQNPRYLLDQARKAAG